MHTAARQGGWHVFIPRTPSENPIWYSNGTQWGFSWSEGRNLTAAAKSSTTLTFQYDASGIRTQKNSANSGSGRNSAYLYAGGKLLRETRAVSVYHGPSSSSILDFTYDATGSPYSLIYNNGRTTATYYYITNLQGDVMYLVDETGAEVAAYTYDPYGKVLSATGTMAGVNPLRYRGYYQDSETGFYYLQSRYYDPEVGRFINADSYASTGQGYLGYNMFAYCNNNPINFIDPTGHSWQEIWNFFETAFIETQNTIAAWESQYSKCGEVAMADGGLPFADVAGLVGVTLLTIGAVGIGFHKAITAPPKTIPKAEGKAETIAVPTESDSPVFFPVDPNAFAPVGLVKVLRPGTTNGRLISWMDPLTNTEVFRWDENPNFSNGSHYHIYGSGHYYPGDAVPEPYATIYFPLR